MLECIKWNSQFFTFSVVSNLVSHTLSAWMRLVARLVGLFGNDFGYFGKWHIARRITNSKERTSSFSSSATVSTHGNKVIFGILAASWTQCCGPLSGLVIRLPRAPEPYAQLYNSVYNTYHELPQLINLTEHILLLLTRLKDLGPILCPLKIILIILCICWRTFWYCCGPSPRKFPHNHLPFIPDWLDPDYETRTQLFNKTLSNTGGSVALSYFLINSIAV